MPKLNDEQGMTLFVFGKSLLNNNLIKEIVRLMTMFKFDVRWMYSDYCYYDEDEIPRLKDNAPKEIIESYNHYKE